MPPLAGPPVDHRQARIGEQPYGLSRQGMPHGQEQGPGEAQDDAGRVHATALRLFSIEAKSRLELARDTVGAAVEREVLPRAVA